MEEERQIDIVYRVEFYEDVNSGEYHKIDEIIKTYKTKDFVCWYHPTTMKITVMNHEVKNISEIDGNINDMLQAIHNNIKPIEYIETKMYQTVTYRTTEKYKIEDYEKVMLSDNNHDTSPEQDVIKDE